MLFGRYPGDYLWAMALWPFYLYAATATNVAERVANGCKARADARP